MNTPDMLTTALSRYGLPLVQSLAVIIIAWIVFYLFKRGLSRFAAKGLIPIELRRIIYSVGKWLTLIVLLLVILGLFGISVAAFWAALSGVLVMVAVGFVAVWSVLSNFFCFVMLLIFAPFRIDDEIEIQDPAAPIKIRGRVLDINLMFTTLLALDQNADGADDSLLRIPNNLFFQKLVRTWPGKQSQSLKSYLAQDHRQAHKE